MFFNLLIICVFIVRDVFNRFVFRILFLIYYINNHIIKIQVLHFVLLDFSFAKKLEITDCYDSSSYVRLISLKGKRSFKFYLVPTGKEECNQLPRGLNITVFANKLVDSKNKYISNSEVIYNFSYQTTVGISINCKKCSNDNYLASDSVIITMESAIHFTRVVLGSVQTQKGYQTNCFSPSQMVIDFNYISVKLINTQSCPQLISKTSSMNLLSLDSADIYIVYQNKSIERFEKLQFSTDFKSSRTPMSWIYANTLNFTVQNIGRTALTETISFVQFQLHFASLGPKVSTTVQANRFSVVQFQYAYESMNAKVQQGAAFIDLQLNMTKKVTGTLNYQGYNNYITEIQPDRVEMEFFGQSEKIPPEQALDDDVFVTSSAALPYVEPPMSFKTNLSAFQFQNTTIPIRCHDKQCAVDLQRYIHTNDSNFQLSMLLKFYKSDVLLKSMNLVINQPTDSCFDSARGVLDGNKLNILAERNAKSTNCSLVQGQKVDLVVNLTQVDKITNQTSTQQLVLQNVDFRYNMSVQLSQEQVSNVQTYLAGAQNSNLTQLISFSANGNSQDYVYLDEFYEQNMYKFQDTARILVIVAAALSASICTVLLFIPQISRKLQPLVQRLRLQRQKIVKDAADVYDL
ncbi:Conserved_hypothetical protein [Hexamita inflata]|uniref:Transmembrane protein n=1 Tax=Hexamita inflata TaxID=28002 RepID=A0AA86QN48_9EUKA|nr:Conserved hypothetical protein [Hexamita inflata]